MRRRILGVAVLICLGILLVAAGGGVLAQETPTETETDGDETDQQADSDAPFGASVSSFMQASAADAEGQVNDGMFEAALDRDDLSPEDRRSIVEQRIERLERRSDRLADDREQISTDDERTVRDYALATRVSVGAASLERSATGTERAAEAAGLDTDRLNEIRTNASQLTGQQVADLARGVVGTPAAQGQGPPEDRGQGNGPDAAGGQNQTDDDAPGASDEDPPTDDEDEADSA